MSFNKIYLSSILVVSLLIIFSSCKKDEEQPSVNLPPSCKIMEPRTGQDIPWGEAVAIIVNAADLGGVSKVIIRINNKIMDTLYASPYQYIWQTNEVEPGNYDLRAISFDNTGLNTYSSIVSVEVTTDGLKPVADFTASIYDGYSPLTVDFIDQSQNSPTSWLWDFGDGHTSTQQNPTHTFYGNWSYTITLTATNPNGSDQLIRSNMINVGGYGQPCPEVSTVSYRGMTYHTLLIGNQCWMKENLNYETGNSWCYNDDPVNCEKYGRLYDWSTIMNGANSSNSNPSGVQGICPDGWHIPSDREWKVLEGAADSLYTVSYSGWDTFDWRGSNAGKRLKSFSGWYENGNGTDNFGFAALPGAWRNYSGYFYYYKEGAFFWTSTKESSDKAIYRSLYYTRDQIERNYKHIDYGMSVRCVKD